MPYSKDWKRYEPMMQFIVEAWEGKKRAPMTADFETASGANGFRLKFYAFIGALEKCSKKEEKAKELWDIARGMTFRVAGMNGERVDFVKDYAGPVRLTICEAGFDRSHNVFSEFARQNGILTAEEELEDPNRGSFAELMKLRDEMEEGRKKAEEVVKQSARAQPILPPFQAMEIKRQPKGPAAVLPSEGSVTMQIPEGYPQEEVDQALRSPFNERILDGIEKKDPDAPIRLALRQLSVFPPESGFYREAKNWLTKRGIRTE
jgi:hypothetical protein